MSINISVVDLFDLGLPKLIKRNSQYFIRKQSVDKTWESSLADWCLMIEDGIDEQDTHFKDKVF